MPRRQHVVIVGGGFSGAITALHLVRGDASGRYEVTVVNPTPHIGRGLAYRFDDDNLLLNVPAGNMSALADEPNHFVAYCQGIDPSINSGSFVSRRLYGEYLQDLWSKALAGCHGLVRARVDEAVALTRVAGSPGWCVSLASGQSVQADQVVLATGHQAPKFPIPVESEVQARVIGPWDFAAMRRLASDGPIVIVGSGHTAIDALFCVAQSQPPRPIYLLSRHGLLPQRHRLSPAPPKQHAFPDYLRDIPTTVRDYTRALRQHLKTAAHQGRDWRDTLNELRSHTPSLWQSWSVVEQRRFLRHLQAYWDIHRHRLAPTAAQRLDRLMAAEQARPLAGRVLSVQKAAQGVAVHWRPRGAQHTDTLQASAVINCTGPDTNIRQPSSSLFAQLLHAGLIQPDVHGLGLGVSPDHRVLNSQRQPVDHLWYMGPLLKGVHWEATAVPELRVHAQRLALTLLAQSATASGGDPT